MHHSQTHGHTVGHKWSREYRTWSNMIYRCTNPGAKGYANYGGRGIRVCERWKEFANFFADMGRKPTSGHSIDRIDVNGHYEPSNCRWATQREQCSNTRYSILMTLNGRTMTQRQWAQELGINDSTLHARRKRYGDAIALTMPRRQQRSSGNGYRGVYWRARRHKWEAMICAGEPEPSMGGRRGRIHIGYFDDPVEAAKAYDRASQQYFGAAINFPNSMHCTETKAK